MWDKTLMVEKTKALPSRTTEYKLVTITENGVDTSVTINLTLLTGIIFIFLFIFWVLKKISKLKIKGFNVNEVTLIDPITKSSVKFVANKKDIRIAHKVWTELITRKAALPFEKEKDVIVEVYDSWYSLFQCVREQISSIPVEKLQQGSERKNIEFLIDITTRVLNEGLRPHLTEWQAKYRSWYVKQVEKNEDKSPQDIQKLHPDYDEIVNDIEKVNIIMREFAEELKKLART